MPPISRLNGRWGFFIARSASTPKSASDFAGVPGEGRDCQRPLVGILGRVALLRSEEKGRNGRENGKGKLEIGHGRITITIEIKITITTSSIEVVLLSCAVVH